MTHPSEKSGAPDGPVSIRDVALAAGVSIATVSRVIHDSPMVAAPTKARVREVIRQLGYVPNPIAQAFGSGESRVIGLALPRFHGEFMTWLLHGADEEATALGYHLLMTTIVTGADGRRRQRIVGSGLVDAMVVVITEEDDPLAGDVLSAGIPAVAVDADLSARGLDSVVLDNQKGTREAVEHLLRWCEPSQVRFVGGPRTNFDAAQRARAFRDALAAAGHEPGPDQVVMGDYSVDWGKEWAIRMHQRGLLSGGVLAANDKIACGILHSAQDAGVKVPDQLRVIGFNDSLIARISRPMLSTVALPMAEMGAAAVRMVVRRLETGDQPAATCRRLPTRLVIRESSTVENF